MGLLHLCFRAAILRTRSWFSSKKFQLLPVAGVAAALLLNASSVALAQGKPASTTVLSMTANGNPATSVPSGTVVTLTATVTAASGLLKTGQVNFCDASAKFCTDIHLLATTQLTSTGNAVLKFRPGAGSHSYKAMFVGTNVYAGSVSAASALAVTGSRGPFATSTTIAETGSWGNYALTGTVTEAGGTTAPTGTVSFLDASNGNSVLATGALGTAVAGVGWPNQQSITSTLDTSYVLVADLNNDGIPDIVDDQNPVVIYLGNANGTYSEAPAIPSLSSPPSGPMVIADFNGDGVPDLALGMYESTFVSVLLGNGDGTFAAPIAANLSSGTYDPSLLLTADLNGDGIPDLVVVNNYESQIDILLGNGDGTFTPAAAPSTSVSPFWAAVGDFNGDGKTDLAISDKYSDAVAILFGNGDGTFTAAGTAHSGARNAPIAAADLNGDGKIDLAVATGDSVGVAESVTILTGNGDGTFTPTSSGQNPDSTGVTWIQVADFNQDGAPDVVLANSGGNATVFLNNGGGLFTDSFSVVTGLSVADTLMVGVGDLNGDGYPDIVAGGYYNNTLGLFLTAPTETATASATVSIAAPGTHLADASYAGDGNYNASVSSTTPLWGTLPVTATALTLTSGGSAATSVAPGTVVTLTATVKAGASPVTTGEVDFCDASASFCTDIHVLGTAALSSTGTASFSFAPGAGQHSYKAIFVEGGSGMSSASNTVALTVGPAKSPVYSDTAALEVTGQPGSYSLTATLVGYGGLAPPTGSISFLDTSFGSSTLATASLGASTSGVGWLISQTPAAGAYPISEVTADFNRDGIPDLAVLSTSSSSGGTAAISVLFGKSDGTFTAGPIMQLTAVSAPTLMIGGDFNGDGKADLAVLSSTTYATDTVNTYLGNGDGTFNVAPASTVTNPNESGGDGIPGAMVAGDFNGDGRTDLAIVGDYINAGGVNILLGNGDGTFQQLTSLFPNLDFGLVATGDFNGDGIPDLAVTNYFEFGANPTILLGKGDGTFTAMATSFTLDYFPTSILVGDFNGDGVLDLAFSDLDGVEIALGNGDGTFKETSASPMVVPYELHSLTAGDFNHDGKLDIAGICGDAIVVLTGAGDGTFTVTNTTATGSQEILDPFALVAADFNGDGVPDLAVLTKNEATTSILLTESTETATATVTGIAPIGAGTHNVDAHYAGDGNYPANTSSTVALSAGLTPLVITPAAGNYSSAQNVTITESIPGATIYYAEYGTITTPEFVAYTGPIPLIYGGFETIYAYASETGYQQSSESMINYALTFPPSATPTVSPTPGYYAGAQTVTITDSEPAAQIYYTTNGTVPGLSSTLYTGPITVSSSETIVARAISSGHALSQSMNAQYIIGSSSVPMIYSIAGTGSAGYTGDGGAASLAQVDYPYSVVKDAAGNIYFSDDGNHMVRKIAAGTGIISVVAGNGYSGYSGDGDSAIRAELASPVFLALDHAGNLYIADFGNDTIRAVNLSSGVITTYAGNPTATSTGDGGPAIAADIDNISGLAVDASNNLYIASSGAGTIRVVNAITGIISTFAGAGSFYNPNSGIGDGGPVSGAFFRSPDGLAFDASGSLYIADAGFDIVRKITASGGIVSSASIITTVAGTPPSANGATNSGYKGDGGLAISALLNGPTSVALDGTGNLFIDDYSNGVIREVASASGIITTYAGNGNSCNGPSGDGGPAASASLCSASSVSSDAAGNLLLGDDPYHVREIVAAGAPPSRPAATPIFSVPAGNYMTPQSVAISDTTPGASIYVTVDGTSPVAGGPAGYSLPVTVTGTITLRAVAVAPGSLVSAPATATYNIGASAPLISTVAGNGVQELSPAGGPALNLSMEWPSGLAIDKAGDLYIADTESQVVWKVTKASGQASLYAGTSGVSGYAGDGGPAAGAKLDYPESLALDSSGDLYIADTDNNVIREVVAATGTIETIAGSANVYGPAIGDGGPATSAWLSNPFAIALDSAGNLYIADLYHERIRMVAAATGIITTVAGNGTTIASGDGGLATSAGIQYPNALAVDSAGNIYIGDASEGTIRKVTASTGNISTFAGVKNLPGNTGDGGLSASAEVNPYSLAVDPAGDIFMANLGEVREISASAGTISSVAGIDFVGYSGDGGAATAAQVDSDGQIAFDTAGNMYFTDGPARIRKVALALQTAATPTFSPVAGTYTAAQSVSISDTTPGATVYYTTDGSTPTSTSTAYTAPIAVGSSETIKSIAMEVGYYPSAIASAAYTINTGAAGTPTLSSFSPAHTSAAGAQFTLSVTGSGFTASSVVDWGPSALTTTFVSSTQLTAVVPASDIASPGTASISVQTPGTSASNALDFEIDSAGTNPPPTVSSSSNTVTAGGTVTYTVTLPSSASSVSARCLNLPAGATCTYSSSAGTLTITTASTTLNGTYVITVVFTETLPGAAFILLPFLLLPMRGSKKPRIRRFLQVAVFGSLAALTVVVGCGGGGGGGGSTTPPPSNHQVTTSTIVTLIVQ
jgi:sugar lactone lactonase YvrE